MYMCVCLHHEIDCLSLHYCVYLLFLSFDDGDFDVEDEEPLDDLENVEDVRTVCFSEHFKSVLFYNHGLQ